LKKYCSVGIILLKQACWMTRKAKVSNERKYVITEAADLSHGSKLKFKGKCLW
jgi:hypothetical protein